MPRAVTVQQRPEMPPPLKWAGGKRWLVPELRKFWKGNEDRRLVEPFVGGMAVALGLRPERALLNDFNEHVINFYSWLQKGLKQTVPFGADEGTYYANRTRFNELVSAGKHEQREAAMLFYYLNRNCYNGLCRFNSKGGFNTPHGKYKRPQYVEDLTGYKQALHGWELKHGDFKDVELDRRDFVYADPPYDNAFTDYSKGGFGWEDQVRLANWLAGHDGPVVVSNHATDRILKLYADRGFDISRVVPAPRMINCTGDRAPALEVVAVRGFTSKKVTVGALAVKAK